MVLSALAWLVSQEAPDPNGITSILGQLGAVGLVVAYAYWRQRHSDELLKQRDAVIVEMTNLMITQTVPALEKAASASNEVRMALERIIEAQRRGEYAPIDHERRARDR